SASSLRSVGSRLSRALSFVDDSNSSINGEVGRRRQQDTGGGDSSGSDEFPSYGGDSRAEDPSARGDWRAARWRTDGASSEPGGGAAKANGGVERPPAGNSWLGSLIATIIGNLKISISNIHVRYEDFISNPGHPFACGITLAKLRAFTMDEQGNETFDTNGALDKLHK
ncbi:hypothetical protein Dimus_020178, partial [Dionaea muscipula]